MQNKFEPHIRPQTSRLEKWRSEITKMRSLSWPHQKIANWLDTECDFKITGEAVRQFCKVRDIQKSTTPQNTPQLPSANPKPERHTIQHRSTTKRKKLFEYEDRPIQRSS